MQQGSIHLIKVLLDGICNLFLSFSEQALEVLQLLDPVF